jgi:hypothetical protein
VCPQFDSVANDVNTDKNIWDFVFHHSLAELFTLYFLRPVLSNLENVPAKNMTGTPPLGVFRAFSQLGTRLYLKTSSKARFTHFFSPTTI